MIAFEVKDMTCGHCVSNITKAVKAADSDAKVNIDLGSHRVEIESSKADADELRDAISEAGYTPIPAASQAPAEAAKSGGGCCG